MKIKNGDITSVVAYGSLVYAAVQRTNTVRILQRLGSGWMQHHVIHLDGISATANWISLSISNGKLFACDLSNDALYTYTTNGVLVDKCGRYGSGVGETNDPFICGSDAEGAVMVADFRNNRLQVRDSANEWHVINLQPEVRRPLRAVLLDGALFVVSRPYLGECSLIKYN